MLHVITIAVICDFFSLSPLNGHVRQSILYLYNLSITPYGFLPAQRYIPVHYRTVSVRFSRLNV